MHGTRRFLWNRSRPRLKARESDKTDRGWNKRSTQNRLDALRTIFADFLLLEPTRLHARLRQFADLHTRGSDRLTFPREPQTGG